MTCPIPARHTHRQGDRPMNAMHPRPMQSSAVRYIHTLRKLSHAQQASCGDMIEAIDMLRAGDLRHIDEASEAFSAADYAEPVDPIDLIGGEPCEIAYSVTAEPGEVLTAGGHGVPTARSVTDYAARIAAVRIGDHWMSRDDFRAMVGDERFERFETLATAQLAEAAE